MSFSLLSIPSLIALLIKCYFLFYVFRQHQKVAHTTLIALVTALSFLNLTEFCLFTPLGDQLWLFILYFISVIISLGLATHLVALILNKRIRYVLLLHALGLIVIFLIIFTDLIIVDIKRLHHTYTRVPGDFYFLFQFFAISELFVCLFWIVKATFSHSTSNQLMRAKSSIILVSLLPLVISAITIIIFMALGYKMNAVVIIPIMTTIFLAGCIYACMNQRVFDLSMLIPGTVSWKNRHDMMFFLYAGSNKINLQSQLLNLEKKYIEDAIKQNNGKVSRAADALGYTPGKLDYRLKSIHKIENQKAKTKSKEMS